MNQDSFKNLQLGATEIARFLLPFLIIWLLGAVGLGWLVNSLLILFGLLLLAPILAFLGFRWWLKRSLVEGECPVCNYGMMGLNKGELQCPSCGEPLKVENGRFNRLTPPGTIDVNVVEVSVQTLED